MHSAKENDLWNHTLEFGKQVNNCLAFEKYLLLKTFSYVHTVKLEECKRGFPGKRYSGKNAKNAKAYLSESFNAWWICGRKL